VIDDFAKAYAGHADILREQLDGAVGAGPSTASDHDDATWEAHRTRIENAARAAQGTDEITSTG
jgi:hypothetical protein